MSIFLSDAIVDPWTMVIIGCYTFFALVAVSGSIGLIDHTDSTISAISFGTYFSFRESQMMQILIVLNYVVVLLKLVSNNTIRIYFNYLIVTLHDLCSIIGWILVIHLGTLIGLVSLL